MLGLVQILDEYMCLKKQKEMLHQQRVMVMQEKYRLQMFVQGLQNVINTFQKPLSLNFLGMSTNSAVVPQWRLCNETPSGVSSIASIGSAMQNTFGNFSTPMINASDKKRKDTETVNGPAVGKQPRGRPPGRKNQVQGQNTLPQSSNVVNNQVVSWQSSSSTLPPSGICAPSGSQVQGSNFAKGSFNHPLFCVPNHSQILETPPRTQSSHCDTYVSPTNFLVASCNREASSSYCTMISTDRVMFDPVKQMAYKESSHCSSPIKADTGKASKKDDVRGKLNFDASNMPESLDKSLANEVSTSELDKGVVIFDIDFSNLDWSLQGTSFEDFFLTL